MTKKPVDSSVDLDKLVALTKGYSGADIASLVNAAAMSAIKEYITINRSHQANIEKQVESKDVSDTEKKKIPLTISMKHFENALKKVKKNVSVKS
jgi:transitional endoplasmic reticulum ATPase